MSNFKANKFAVTAVFALSAAMGTAFAQQAPQPLQGDVAGSATCSAQPMGQADPNCASRQGEQSSGAPVQNIRTQSIQVLPMDQGQPADSGFSGGVVSSHSIQHVSPVEPRNYRYDRHPYQAARVNRVDVYLDGRRLMSAAPRSATQDIWLTRGVHTLLVVPSGWSLNSPIQELHFKQSKARNATITFGNNFAVTFR